MQFFLYNIYIRKGQTTYQLRTHFLQLCYEVGEEFRHILLLASVERLVVHRVHLTETPRVVRLTLALQQIREHLLQLHQRTAVPIIRRTLPAKKHIVSLSLSQLAEFNYGQPNTF